MHILPCPSCDWKAEVPPAQAGNQLTCPECGGQIQVPKLGELRQLPLAQVETVPAAGSGGDGSMGSRMGFVVCALLAVASLLTAGFSAIRYLSVDVAHTTESHAVEMRDAYMTMQPAELIREWEQMEEYGIAATAPMTYRIEGETKRRIGMTALAATIAAVLAMLGAAFFALSGRQKTT